MGDNPGGHIEVVPEDKDVIRESTENKSEIVNAEYDSQLILSNNEIAHEDEISQQDHIIPDDKKSLKEDEVSTNKTASPKELNITQIVNEAKSEISEDIERPEEISEKLGSSYPINEDVDQSLNPSESISIIDSAHEQHRQDLINQQNELLERQRKAAQFNIQLQTILANHFRRKRVDAGEISRSRLDSRTSSVLSIGIDHSVEYAKHMKTLSQIKKQYSEQKERLDAEISSIKKLSEGKIAEATKAHDDLVDFIMKQAGQAISSKTGRVVSVDIYKDLLDSWQRKNSTITVERLENIKLQRQVDKIKEVFKAYDLSESLHLIDFEQMKIENQTYNEKIEERNEETGKLKMKINNTVQILTHSNEKLSSSEAGFSQLKKQLDELTDELNRGRDSLAKLKQKRDALRTSYTTMQKACGLLGQTDMLRGFEESVDKLEAKKQELSNLKQQTRELQEKTKHYEHQISRIQGEMSRPN
nr:coiled coil domain containing protein 96 [Hymenolepis microstoma]